jgi:hypothetical protein
VGLFQRWVDATANVGVFTWLGQQAMNAAGLIRAAGARPGRRRGPAHPTGSRGCGPCGPVRRQRPAPGGLLRVDRPQGRLLARCGTTGKRISQGLAHAGAKVAGTVRAAVQHPIMEPIAQAMRATLALVRPLSQGFVAHRLLGALVPIMWLRTAIELLLIPLPVDTNLVGFVGDLVSTPPAEPTTNGNANATNRNGNGNGKSGKGTDDARARRTRPRR